MSTSSTFFPIHSFWTLSVIGCLVLFLLGILGILYFYQKSKSSETSDNTKLFLMLFGFLALIGLGGFAISGLYQTRLQPITVSEKGIYIQNTQIPFLQIEDAYLYTNKVFSPIASDEVKDSTTYLIIKTVKGRNYQVADYDYPVDSIMTQMQLMLPKGK